ncbi:Protein of unknown function (DUF2975) [Lacibacter cauensis]|uniref:DUF2975 family protein n=1 Tax=Lacibacter cauensis TaxID=510947 RepID=A0A562SRY4_9BACT|nr:DUF2975 domain-containing protein [Lacibacter cauensis]TWI83893.1 Protein of unknown function (DUF2975) [Lacibacter cauensis]
MEIRITTSHILKVLEILSWIIFIGLCIEAGALLFNTVYAMYKPIVAEHFWNGADLSQLYSYDKGHFVAQMSLVVTVAVMKAMIFYLLVKMFYDKKFSLDKPFNAAVTRVVLNIAYLCLGAGFFSMWSIRQMKWFSKKGIAMPQEHLLNIDGADVWLFMAVVLIVIAQVFKKGIEIQNENDLTV